MGAKHEALPLVLKKFWQLWGRGWSYRCVRKRQEFWNQPPVNPFYWGCMMWDCCGSMLDFVVAVHMFFSVWPVIHWGIHQSHTHRHTHTPSSHTESKEQSQGVCDIWEGSSSQYMRCIDASTCVSAMSQSLSQWNHQPSYTQRHTHTDNAITQNRKLCELETIQVDEFRYVWILKFSTNEIDPCHMFLWAISQSFSQWG